MEQKKKHIRSFGGVLLFWVGVACVLGVLAGGLRRAGVWESDPGLNLIYQIGMGLDLLLRPVAPENLTFQWGEVKSRRFVRVLAAVYLVWILCTILF